MQQAVVTSESKVKLLEEALQEFTYQVSHDLSAPLREATNFARLLEEKYGNTLDGKAQDYLAHVLAGSRRAQDMLEGLLVYSRLNTLAGEMAENVPVADIVALAVKQLQESVTGSGAVIEAGALPSVHANAKQLAQLFCCLLSNAIKFAKAGCAPQIEVHGESIGKGWRFCVSDRGIGIPAAEQAEIFKPLRQLHAARNYPGVGMGLAIAQRIVARHGGRIWADAAPGGGTQIWFTLSKAAALPQEAA